MMKAWGGGGGGGREGPSPAPTPLSCCHNDAGSDHVLNWPDHLKVSAPVQARQAYLKLRRLFFYLDSLVLHGPIACNRVVLWLDF